jgi:hypothetical protein
MDDDTGEDDAGFGRERRKRNVALGLILAGLVVLVFMMSMVKWAAQWLH